MTGHSHTGLAAVTLRPADGGLPVPCTQAAVLQIRVTAVPAW